MAHAGSWVVAGVAWLGYVPIPGLGWVAMWLAPDDPLSRYHGRQANWLVLALYAWLIFVGFLTGISDAPAYLATMGLVSGIPMTAMLVGCLWGIQSAARGRYARIRPIWDIMSR